MPSFDIVSEVDIQEVDNAVNQAQKEIGQRYDFKGTKFSLNFDKDKAEIKLSADEDSRVDALYDVLSTKLIRRGIDLTSLELGKKEQVGGMMIAMNVKVKQGIDQPTAKTITKLIKDTKLKVDASIQGEQLRVSGKNIDDLQEVIGLLKSRSDVVKTPLQFVNMRK